MNDSQFWTSVHMIATDLQIKV